MISAAMNSNRDESDVVVIGGGVVGMTLAYGLSQRNQSVIVLDEGDDAFRASRGNFALIWVHGKGLENPAYARWSATSANLWESFASELSDEAEMPLFYSRPGGFIVCLSEDELEQRAFALRRLHNIAPDTASFEILDHAQMKKMMPGIGPDVVGGTYSAADGHINALRLLGALHKVANQRGVSYRAGEHVATITPSSSGFRVRSASGEVSCNKIVLAAGLGNKDLAPMVGLTAPVAPERGQIIVTEKLEHFLDYPTGSVRQTNEGGVLIGDSKEDAGFDKSTDSRTLATIAKRAVQTFPRLASAQIVRTWGALRVMSPDGYPIYDESITCPGAYVVTCHSGITLAAAHTRIIAEAIAAGDWPAVLDPFSARRLAHVPASE